jgi:glycosyltransferase involved in cell wall biosynthesis
MTDVYDMQTLRQSRDRDIDVSIVVPVFNEKDNVEPLVAELRELMDGGAWSYECIFIDDGSHDDTVGRLLELTGDDERFTVLELMRNFGQTAAMAAGFNHARGGVIVPMDGDLQNDPNDIPALVAKLDENGEQPGKWDIVSGWRKNRQDKLMSRRFPSILANRLIKKLTWTTEIHDFGCSMKAYRRQVLEDVHLYGEMHRFLPAICKWRGARVTEMVVHHRPRIHGESKYGLKRTGKVLLDLLTVKFLGDYLTKPIYFFGKVAGMTMLIALASFGVAVLQRFGILYWGGNDFLTLNRNILVNFAAMLFLMSVFMLLIGVLAELLVRIYHESQNLTPYKVRNLYRGTYAAADPPPGDHPQRNPRTTTPAAGRVAAEHQEPLRESA